MAGHHANGHEEEEHLDILTKTGQKTGFTKPRSAVHRDGDYHRSVHVWIFAESTQELLLQKRADWKDSWPGQWDISSAGHISAGDSSLVTARRELHEELGVILPTDAFELLFVYLQNSVINNGKFINNEYGDVYLVTTRDPIPLEAFTLQESEVSAVKYISMEEYRRFLAKEDPQYVPYDVDGQYWQLFEILSKRSNLDENEVSLTTGDSAMKVLPEATKAVPGWKGIEYRAAFPVVKPPGGTFYPPDMEKAEFELWKNSLPADKQKEATGFFSVNKRKSERILDNSQRVSAGDGHDLYIVPYSEEYNDLLAKAANLLHKAGDFEKVEDAVESLSKEILTVQASGDKEAYLPLLSKYCSLTQLLKHAIENLEMVQVPVDILPKFSIVDEILKKSS